MDIHQSEASAASSEDDVDVGFQSAKEDEDLDEAKEKEEEEEEEEEDVELVLTQDSDSNDPDNELLDTVHEAPRRRNTNLLSKSLSEEPNNLSLLLRHRAPSRLSGGSTTSDFNNSTAMEAAGGIMSRHRQELIRIHLDSANYTRHALEFDGIDGNDNDNDEPWKWCWKRQQREREREQQQQQPKTAKTNGKSKAKPASKSSWNFHWKGTLQNQGLLPCAQCFNKDTIMNWQNIRKDMIAGTSVAIVAVPLSMSYAKLAGLPAYYGLYANLPACVYPLFGSSRQLAVGPAALVSLLLSTGLSNMVRSEFEPNVDVTSDEYIARYAQLAIQTSLLVGIIKVGMGLFKLGFVTQILSKALISGFTSGAAVMIALSQAKHLLGYTTAVPPASRLHEVVQNLAKQSDEFSYKTFCVGILAIVVLVSLKYLKEHNPQRPLFKWLFAAGPLLVSAISIILTYTLDLDQHGIPIVGSIPPGLPSLTIDQWSPLSVQSQDLWVMVFSIVIIGYVQSFSIAKRIAYKRGSYEIDSSQELIGLGLANIVGSMFQSFPVTGAMGQSAVNDDIGAETGLANLVTTLVVILVLLFLTPVFEYMPLAILAAIVISFVLGMFDHTEAIYLYKVHKFDFSVWMVAFFSTMFLGVEFGLATAIGLSILIVIYESVYPRTAVLGRLSGTSLYRNVKQYPAAEQYDGLVIVRIDSPLYFANAQNIRDKVRKYKRVAAEELRDRSEDDDENVSAEGDRPVRVGVGVGRRVDFIILDLSPVSHIDTTGLHVLEDMHATQKREGVKICFCNPNIPVSMRLVKSGLVDQIGREYFFSSVIDAVQWCLAEMDKADADAVESSPAS